MVCIEEMKLETLLLPHKQRTSDSFKDCILRLPPLAHSKAEPNKLQLFNTNIESYIVC